MGRERLRDGSNVLPMGRALLQWVFDQFQHGYYVSGEQVGKAWNAGAGMMKNHK